MNKYIAVFVVLVLAIIAALIYTNTAEAPVVQNPENPGTVEQPTQGRVMDIETYVRGNISELSPEPEVLGGTFYVTSIEAADGQGVVEYEDGHIALTADFTYEVDTERGITITSFVVRQ